MRTTPCRPLGFTLLELLVVVTIVALASAGVSLAMRDADADLLEREGLRLAALLEAGRAQSRATGLPIVWQIAPGGFVMNGATARSDAKASLSGLQPWLSPRTQATVVPSNQKQSLLLGPEPLLPAQTVVLQLGERQLTVSTNGLHAFSVQSAPSVEPSPAS